MVAHGSGEAASAPLPAGSEPAEGAPALSYSMSAGLVARLKALDIALAVTSYQSGLLYLIGRNPKTGGLNVHQTPILRPMGLAQASDGTLVLAAGFHLVRFVNTLGTAPARQRNLRRLLRAAHRAYHRGTRRA